MNILLVYPKFLVTFWSWKHLLKFISKKAAFPPLGLLTVAAMLPKPWGKKLVDINVKKLNDKDIKWADYVFISAMITQSSSAKEVIARCKKFRVPVVLGGPVIESGYGEFSSVDYFLQGEAEDILPEFLADLQKHQAKRIYSSRKFPDITASPVPLWELINLKDYACLLVQYGRGCPFKCTFCNIAAINGRIPRVKPLEQFLGELDVIYQTGYRGPIMLADDNFIASKKRVKEMLNRLSKWQQDRGHPFEFTAEADITLSDEECLMDSMVLAGFKKVFLGLETPHKASLIECHKLQNVNRDMAGCVKIIQNHGLHPMSGFIVGFDNDPPDTIFDQHIAFYQETGIVFPMIGVLQAPPETELNDRLRREGRLLKPSSGNNTDCYPNFYPKMPIDILVAGYKRIVKTIYSPKKYYERICIFLREYNTAKKVARKVTAMDFKAFIASIWFIGFLGGPKTSYYYWKTLLLALFKYRRAFADAVALQIYGWHFQKIAKSIQKS